MMKENEINGTEENGSEILRGAGRKWRLAPLPYTYDHVHWGETEENLRVII